MNRRRFLIVVACCAAALAGGAGAYRVWAGDAPAIAASVAAEKAWAGEITILDVRSAAEWRQTGLPAGAKAVTIHDPAGIHGFVAAAERAVGGDLTTPVAVICHTGRRSTVAAEALMQAGFTDVYNIREGMAGNPFDGPGWLRHDLPVEECTRC